MLELHSRGISIRAIARLLKCDPTTVLYHVNPAYAERKNAAARKRYKETKR